MKSEAEIREMQRITEDNARGASGAILIANSIGWRDAIRWVLRD